MKMRKKIVLSLGILCVLILLQGVVFAVLLTQIRAASQELDDANTMTTEVAHIEKSHYQWLQGLTRTLYSGAEFTGSLDANTCSLGSWLESDAVVNNKDSEFHALLDPVVAPHEKIHEAAGRILELQESDPAEAERIYNEEVLPNIELTIGGLDAVDTYANDVMAEKQAHSDSVFTLTIGLVIGFVVFSFVAGIAMMLILIRQIVPPLKKLTDAAHELAKGDVSVEVDIRSKDEMGDLAHAFAAMTASFREQARVLNLIAEGDYSVEMQVASDKDVVGIAISRMLDKTNEMLSAIRQASDQVAGSAAQIASGSQTLATGSTQQAATIEEFSASLSETMNSVEQNASGATQSLAVTNRAGELMQDSMASMNEMLEAMRSIDESSQNIRKVIKVIDDIAFQTNILALNAAVEAARAGQHGKGFAVVADEVRSLAAKSAEAAQETAALIEGSSQRVAQGNAIVERTSESLVAVGESAQENLVLINEIADNSKGQTAAISQLSEGIGEISNVVQANSATAQQSAASAEELSAQSEMLKRIVLQFRLREAGPATAALPAYEG